MAKKKKTTSQKNYSAQDYLNMARDAEKKTQRETELRESRTATDYLNMARQAQGQQPIQKRKKEEDQEKENAGEKLNRAALLMSRMPGAGDLKRQELNRTARALQQAAARSYKSDGKNWSLAGTGSVFDPIGTTAKRREFESGLDTELLQSNLNRLTEQEKREQSARKEQNAKKNASSLHQRTQPKEWMMPVKREFGSRVGSGVETFGGGGGKIDAQKEPETAREALFGESLTNRKARVQNALYEAASAADRAQRSAFDRKGAQERLAEIAGLKQTDEQQREADYLDMAEGDDTAWLSPAEMQTLKEKNGTYGEKYAQEERALNRGLNRSERYVYENAMTTDSSFDRLAEEGRAMDTRMKNAEEVLAYPHDARAAAEAEKLVKYTTDAERKTYYYTLRTKGQEAADAYLDALDADLNRRRGEAQLEATRQTVNSGALGAIGANAYSVLSSVGETPAYISNLIQFLRGQDIDPYSPENMVSRVNEEIRGQTTQNIENGAPGFLGKALGFGYGVGMDLARSRYNMMLGLGMGGNSKIGKWTSSALMGTSAAQSALTDALDRGATDEQATATSIFSGIWETLFEEWSLENLLHLESPTSRRQWLTNVLLQSATEGSEELFTEMANTLTDELIMKDLSNYRLNKKAYEASGLTEEEARRNAMADVAKNWGMAALGGFASGAVGAGVHQGIEYHQNRRNERFQNAMKAYENNRQQQAAPQTVQEAASAAAQNDRLNNSKQNITETQQTSGETNGASRQTAARDGSVPAAYEGGGTSENVEIDQQNPVSRVEKGTVYLRTADGSDVRASDVTFGDERDNLLAAEGVGRMSPAGITGMLNHYDGTKATAKEYASAYLSVYNRARAGMTVQQAVYDSAQTRSALTEEAAMAAYAAGEKMNMGRIVPMTRAEKQRQQAQLDLVSAINEKFSKSGVKIEMVDRIEGYGGQEANGRWDSETNTIYVSKNADDHAYAYIAMHELTHAMKSRNDSEFQDFSDWVVYYLNESGQDADALVRGEMIAQAQAMGLMERQKANLTTEEQLKLLDGLSEEQYRQLNELAQEELICNTVPSILQNENVLMDLYHTKPTLFERIKNFLKEFIDAVRGTGKELGKTRAFQQMEAMGKNQAALEDIYNRMVQMAENGAQQRQAEETKFSIREDENGKYVEVDTDQDIFENISEKEYPRVVEKYITSRFRGTVIGETNRAYVDRKSAKEYSHPAKFYNEDQKYFAKAKAATELGNLLEVSRFERHESDTGHHPEAKGGWDKYLTVFYVDGKYYEGEVNIMLMDEEGKRRRFHDVTKIRDITSDMQGRNAPLRKNASENSISDSGEKFNEKFSLKEDSDFEYDEDSNLTREQQRQVATTEFKRWFGDSKVVDEEGKPLVVYHGTDEKFNAFDMSKGRANMDIQGAFFSPYELDAEGYGENVGAYYLSIQNPADEGTAYKALNRFKGQNNAGIKAREYLQKQGYDGVYNGYDEYIAFEPTQIKSAKNNVGTFDPFNPDVRYSLKETDEDVRKQVDLTRELMEETGGYRLTQEDAERVMKRVAKEFGSQTDASELAADFARVMEYARQQNADMDQVDNELLSIADKMIANSQQLDEEHEEEVKPIREKLRKTAISLTDSQKAEAASMTGSLGAYRKALFGQVRLSQQSGVSLDSVWSELSDLSPTLFPADTAEGDMPRLLMEAADAVKPIIENQYGLDSEEAAQYAVMQMVDQYTKLPGVQTAAKNQKRMGLTASQYRELMDAFLQKSEKQFQSAWVKTWMQKEKAIGAQKEQEARTKYQEWKRKQIQRNQEWRKEELQSAKNWKQEKRQEMSLWRQEQRNAMQEKYRQWRQTDTETRKNREAVNTYRDRLERTTRTLLNWMEKPNKTQHVPMELQSDVQKVLAGLDFSGKTTLAAKDLGSRIEAMTQRIGELQEKTDENGASSQTFYLERDQQMLDELHHLAAVIGANNGNVYELSAEELRDLNKWMNAVKHVITDVNKNHAKYYQGKYYQGESQYGTIEEVADSTKAELHQKKAYADKKGVTRAWNEMLGKGMVDCFSFFDKMGSAGGEVFGNLRKGFDKHIRNVSAAKSYTESLLKGVDQKTLRQWTDEKKRTEYKTDRGESIRLNTAEVMELYVLNKREQAQSHLYGQGIRTNEKVEPVMLTRGDVERITGTLTKEQKQIADRMQRFLARDCAAWGNEASRVLVGYDKFGEEHYWPIRTDPNSNRTLNADGSAANLSYIKNQSFTKELTEKAQNAIMVESIFGTYTRHISQMSAYNAYAVAMTDLQRWFNTPGVKTEIERAYGSNGVRYITDLMKQINGTADNGKTFGGVPKLVSHAKAAAVGANLSVAIQQPTAYVRAADMISPKYLRDGLFQKSDTELVKKWCPIAEWKSWGFYETDVGRGLNDLIVDQSNALQRATEKSMILAEKGDEWTWGKLWNAVAAETRDLYAGELEPGTDAFYEKVGQRLGEIIDKTQVVDSVFHRSPIMRDRGYSSIFTSFMSESIKTYNMVERAIASFAENRKDPAAKRRLMRTMAVYVVNALAGAMAKSIPAAARDDDKEKNYWEKYLEALVENGKENLLFTNNIPMIKDWLAVLNGEETKRLEYQSIERLASLLAEMDKVRTGKGSKWSGFKWFYRIAQSASDITGVPAYAAIRDAKAIVQTVGSAIGQDWYIPMENETASFSYAAENLYEAIRKGDSTAETRLREKLGETKSPAQIDAAVANVLMQQDSRVAEAAALKLQGKATELNQKKQEMVADGFTAEMVDKAVNRYITEGQAEKEKDLTKELKANLWSREEAVTAIRTAAGLAEGSATTDDVKAIVSELVADSTAKDPAKTVKSGIVSEVKKDYVSLMEEGKTTEAKGLLRVLQDTLGVTDADAKGWVTEGHQESLRTAAEAMDVRALKAAMTKLKKDGKTDQSMKSSIEGVLKKQYLAAKEAGDRGQMEKIIRFLTGLDLKNAKGEKYFTREKIQAWGE